LKEFEKDSGKKGTDVTPQVVWQAVEYWYRKRRLKNDDDDIEE
jgi:hypothetical protein